MNNGTSSADEDKIVREVDVFNCKAFLEQLHLLQYPLRPSKSDYGRGIEDGGRAIQARFQTRTKKLEVDIPLDTRSSAYDRRKGEQISAVSAKTDSSKVQGPQSAINRCVEKQTLSSVNASGRCPSSYALGIFANGQLHLNPLGKIYQMRPKFSHLNTVGKATKAETSQDPESSQDESESETAQSIRVRFADGRQRKKREEKSGAVEDERWVSLRYSSQHNEESLETAKSLSSSVREGCDLEFCDKADRLLRLLVPEAEEETTVDMNVAKSTVSTQMEFKKLPLQEQVAFLLKKAHIVRLNQLLRHLGLAEDRGRDVIAALEKMAVLVQGCWVLKSEILYGREASSVDSTTSPDLLCCARDIVLYKCGQGKAVTRKEVNDSLKIPDEDLEEILSQLTRYVKSPRGWKFRMDTDHDFLTKYPEAVSRQEVVWNSKWLDMQQFIANCNRKTEFSHSKPRRRRNSSRGFNSDNEPMDTTSASLKGPTSPTPPTRGISKGNVKKQTELSNKSGVPEQNGIDYDGRVGVEEEFKKFLYEKLCTKRVLTTSEINKLIVLKLSESADKSLLSKGVPVDSMKKVAAEIGAGSLFSNKTKEAIFLFAGPGSWPEAREFLVQFLMERNGFRFNTFKKACATQVTEMPPDEELRKLLLEYCTTKAGIYSLSGT